MIILITGASAGIGRATALYLSKRGHTVYAAARRMDKLEELTSAGIIPLQLDVTDDESISQCVATVLANHGKIDVLVNNAGYGEYGAIEDVSLENARKQFDTNVFGLIAMTKAVLPAMREQKSGKIINISSMAGRFTAPLGGWYHASKYALEALSDALRMEVKGFGIKVVIVEPGGVKTEWADIAMENAYSASRTGLYSNFTKFADNVCKYQKIQSDPIVIAKIINRAIKSKHPKTRYIGALLSRTLLFTKMILPQKLFDKVMLVAYKNY